MLTKFTVQNFRRFEKAITFDWKAANYEFNSECIKSTYVKTALVYGKNGTGKTNLAWAIFDIVAHITDNNSRFLPSKNYLNENSELDNATFEYSFLFDKTKIDYSYQKNSDAELISEVLKIDDMEYIKYNIGSPFKCLFKGTERLNKNIDKDNKISALKYIYNNSNLDKRNNQNKAFSQFMSFINGMLLFRTLFDSLSYVGYKNGSDNIYKDILKKGNLKDFEKFLNDCEIECQLEETLNDGEPTIGFKIKDKTIPIYLIGSTGTKSLALFYFWWQEIKEGKISLLFIDEFDSSYHFKLSRQIVKRLKEIDCQVVLTTHNTTLLDNDLIRPDCGFIINGTEITSLHNSTKKDIRLAHNIEKMYRSGSFE
ncbi:AAA family ATPase [Acinetobacter sp. WCHA29]|uniref:AAA family ATPase n=1 Tax=Acinetobacter sp. WCHA29 TaxID=2004649 RepID=UPI000B3CEC43|nr:ATP-binding protein [Acinetobacter sp. WCHA29]